MLTNKVALGAFWIFFGRISSHIIALGSTLIVARLLSPEAFGLIALAMSMMAIISAMVDLPVAMALIQLKDPTKQDFDTAFTMSLIRGVLVAGVVAALAWPVTAFYNDDRLFPLMLAFAGIPLLSSLRNSNFEVKAREMKFNFEFSMTLVGKLAGTAATIYIAYAYKSYWAIAIGQLVMVGMQTLMTFVLVPVIPGLSLKSWKKLFNYSAWLGVGWFVNQINWRSDMLMVGAHLGKTTLGHYSVGNQLTTESTQMIIQAVMRSLFSAFSSIQDEMERLRRGFLNAQKVAFAVVMPIAFGLAAMADWMIPLLFGSKWVAVVFVVQMTAPVAAFNTMTAPAKALAMAMGQTRTIFIRDCISLAVRLPLMFYGLIEYGLVGVLVARAVAAVFMLVINMMMVRKFIDLKVTTQFLNISRQLFCGFVMLAAVWGMRQLVHFEGEFTEKFINMCLVIMGGAVAYVAASLITWLMTGKPNGLESRVQDVLGKVSAKLHKKTEAPAA
ncbi:MAG: hypothetical protein CME88_15155 [Hirschia sp.]|nr:hypothetical protein [Hirschia sp.]MBF19715.1 hypothetical protein [Hirschia sp.]